MSSKKKDFNLLALTAAEKQQAKSKDRLKENIQILPELRDLIPPLEGEELSQLEANILSQGCREPLIIWMQDAKDPVLVDGHNRYGICRKHKLDFKILEKDFESLDAVKDFMIDNQLGRRNLTPETASYLRGLKYERYKQKQRNTEHLKQNQKAENADSSDSTVSVKMTATGNREKTSQKLAKEFNVSESTIHRDADFAKGIEWIGKSNPQLKQQIIAGKAKVKKDAVRALGKKQQHLPQHSNIQSLDDIQALAESLKTTQKPKTKQPNGPSTSNPFEGRKLTLADVVRYMLLVTRKYPQEFEESDDEKQNLVQLQKLAVKALNQDAKQQEANWLENALEKEIKTLT